MEEYLNLLPNNLDSMNSLIDRFLNDGIRISKSNFETIEDLFSLEQFQRSKNKRAQLDLAFYSTSIGYFKRSCFIISTLLVWFDLIFLSTIWFFQKFGMIETQQSFLVTTYKFSIALLVFGGIILAVF